VARRPDIVLIVTDDQRWDSLDGMPQVQRHLVSKGVRFSNAFVVDPLCCPSRASILTGSYAHTTGVYANSGPHGGWRAFRRGSEASTIATWLQDAGYRTGLFGKYLNGYRALEIPPGWDRVFAFISARPSYFGYTVNDDGVEVPYGFDPMDYAADVVADEAARFIQTTPRDEPIFLWVGESAPHQPAVPAPRHEGATVPDAPPPPPSFNEADVSDKPRHIRELGTLGPGAVAEARERGARSLLAVDDAVGRIVEALRESGRLETTMIVFTSDNGRSLGEHRWNYKLAPYEETIRVPLVVRFDALGSGAGVVGELALNVDLAPTFAEIAGIQPPEEVEGRSLVPLLLADRAGWRRDFLIEHLRMPRHGNPEIPTYCAIRSVRWKYVRYETGERELYDLRRDPYELENVASVPGRTRLLRRMERRLIEECDPPPPGFVP
jgi:arylsulfatase A-like enzyme